MNFEAVIFDLDGTLVDSIEDIAESMNRVLSENHFPVHSLAAYKTFVGRGLLNLTRVSLPETAQDEKTVVACYNRMLEVYNDYCTEKTKPYEGIIPLLDELKSRELKLAVFSNKADKFTKKIVQTLMPGYFDIVVGMTTEDLKKPNPACALEISEQSECALKTSFIWEIRDRYADSSQCGNVWNRGALGFRTKEELVSAGAEAILSHPLDLIGLRL
jgi:phosphoglycolate phosphatase